MTPDPYALTILTATVGHLCKRWTRGPDGALRGTPYGQAYFHRVSCAPMLAPTVAELARLLRILAAAPAACVIRGQPRPALADVLARDYNCQARRTLDNFDDAPRAWALIDIDTPPPANAPPPDLEPTGYVAAVRATLPPALRDTACAFVLSSSCLIKSHKAGVHLWYLLDAPLPSDVLRAWAPSVGADPSLMHPIQVHYTAAPQFVGLADPLPCRHGVLPGAPALPSAVIRATGERILAVEAARERQHARLVGDARDARLTSDGGEREHATCEQVAESFGIITDTDAQTGALLCDCPRHASDSRRSLQVDTAEDRWYCFGCQKGGGAWGLAAWCLGDDAATESAIVQALRSARLGEKVSP